MIALQSSAAAPLAPALRVAAFAFRMLGFPLSMIALQSSVAALFALALRVAAFALRMLHGPRGACWFHLTRRGGSITLFLFCFYKEIARPHGLEPVSYTHLTLPTKA